MSSSSFKIGVVFFTKEGKLGFNDFFKKEVFGFSSSKESLVPKESLSLYSSSLILIFTR